MHTAISVANKILEIAKKNGRSLTPMQLIKLVYLSHGWMLGLCDRPLLREKVEAWRYGPVIRSLYSAVKSYRDGCIPVTNLNEKAYFTVMNDEKFDSEELAVIEQVYRLYGEFSGIQLSNLTHQEGSPWHSVWSIAGQNSEIPDEIIKDHYKALYHKYTQPPQVATCA